jgi:hypothetical protein
MGLGIGIANSVMETGFMTASTFVFQPGGTAVANVYTNFASLYAVFSAVNGPKEIFFDDSIISPCVVPNPGTPYNFANTTWGGVASYNTLTGGAAVEIADGVTIQGDAADESFSLTITDALYVTYSGSATVVNAAGATQEVNLFLERGAELAVSGTGSLIATSNGAYAFLLAGSGAALSATGAGPVLAVAAGSGGILDMPGGFVGDGTHACVTNSGGTVNALLYAHGFASAGAFTGAGTTVYYDTNPADAQGAGVAVNSVLYYTPANPGSWVTTPTLFSSALDELAGVIQKTATYSVASGYAMSATDALAKLQIPTGTLGGNETVTVPNTVGSVWDFALSQVTLGVNTLTFSTGTGTSASITAAQLTAMGSTGCRVAVSASNRVERLS